MPSINQHPALTPSVKMTAFEHVKKMMCKSLYLVKRTIGISNSAAKLPRKTSMKAVEITIDHEDSQETSREKNTAKITATGKIINGVTYNKEAREHVSLFKNQADVKNQSTHLDEKSAVILTKFTLLKNTEDADVSRAAFIENIAKNIVQDLQKNVMPNEADKLQWQAQEFESYIPAQINRAIDSAALKLDIQGKRLLGDKSAKEKIIQDTLADLGLTQAFCQVRNLADKAQPSITHATMNYMALNKITNTELIADISHRTYEIIYNCPGQIERVVGSAERVIGQSIAAG